MDIERLIELYVFGDNSVIPLIKKESSRRNDPYLKLITSFMAMRGSCYIGTLDYTNYSTFAGVIAKYSDALKDFSSDQMRILELVCEGIPTFKRKCPIDIPLSNNSLSLCRQFKIQTRRMLNSLLAASSLLNNQKEIDIAYELRIPHYQLNIYEDIIKLYGIQKGVLKWFHSDNTIFNKLMDQQYDLFNNIELLSIDYYQDSQSYRYQRLDKLKHLIFSGYNINSTFDTFKFKNKLDIISIKSIETVNKLHYSTRCSIIKVEEKIFLRYSSMELSGRLRKIKETLSYFNDTLKDVDSIQITFHCWINKNHAHNTFLIDRSKTIEEHMDAINQLFKE
jgi:hypothetical protein